MYKMSYAPFQTQYFHKPYDVYGLVPKSAYDVYENKDADMLEKKAREMSRQNKNIIERVANSYNQYNGFNNFTTLPQCNNPKVESMAVVPYYQDEQYAAYDEYSNKYHNKIYDSPEPSIYNTAVDVTDSIINGLEMTEVPREKPAVKYIMTCEECRNKHKFSLPHKHITETKTFSRQDVNYMVIVFIIGLIVILLLDLLY